MAEELRRPKSHRLWGACSPQPIIEWASELGLNTGRVVERIITIRRTPRPFGSARQPHEASSRSFAPTSTRSLRTPRTNIFLCPSSTRTCAAATTAPPILGLKPRDFSGAIGCPDANAPFGEAHQGKLIILRKLHTANDAPAATRLSAPRGKDGSLLAVVDLVEGRGPVVQPEERQRALFVERRRFDERNERPSHRGRVLAPVQWGLGLEFGQQVPARRVPDSRGADVQHGQESPTIARERRNFDLLTVAPEVQHQGAVFGLLDLRVLGLHWLVEAREQ